jgi:hypothetical protein
MLKVKSAVRVDLSRASEVKPSLAAVFYSSEARLWDKCEIEILGTILLR